MLSLQLDFILGVFSNLNDSVIIPSNTTLLHSFYLVLPSPIKNKSYLIKGVGCKKIISGACLPQELPEAHSAFENWYLLWHGADKVTEEIYTSRIPIFWMSFKEDWLDLSLCMLEFRLLI